MPKFHHINFFLALGLGLFLTYALAAGIARAHGDEEHTEKPAAAGDDSKKAAEEHAEHDPVPLRLAMPMMNSERGMYLFAEKGCVTCHSINGVGGHDAVALDAHGMEEVMNPFDFAAKMWRMAPVMIAAQTEAFGEQITFTGEELADIIAFVHDDAQQHEFTEEMLSPRVQEMMHHEHGGHSGSEAHSEEIGHTHTH